MSKWTVDLEDFVTKMPKQFLRRYVEQEPDTPEQLLYRCGCDCEDCERLNAFLGCRTGKKAYFRVAKDRRVHLESKLKDQINKKLVKLDTSCKGTPYTLLVEKTNNEPD
ncbi:hypothetical protein EJ03DRAFT_329578 [Teratosphaeria nubilosa]|uniref:Uncharacterized protein n=1 Tax=Teratosphaeria nubilosa TaxID=161662 RepID=A0A6G1L2D9_9PEZI|nr:hypothetical protein EJ03DRAFT_329578 [Teratosphaeria nubilosa]